MNEYKMSSKPRGVCLIINNMNFDPPLQNRQGSEKDEGMSFYSAMRETLSVTAVSFTNKCQIAFSVTQYSVY